MKYHSISRVIQVINQKKIIIYISKICEKLSILLKIIISGNYPSFILQIDNFNKKLLLLSFQLFDC